MSSHSQRGKVKTIPRNRSQRMPVAPASFTKGVSGQTEDNLGIFSNSELTYALGRHVVGNIGEVMTVDNERILGVIKAVSPDGAMCLTYAYSTQRSKNGQIGDEVKTDAELAAECDLTRAASPDKELVPFFEPSETVKDCSLDEGGFPADEMFKTNKELFSVSSTYNADLREYTTPVDRNAPNFSETEARCAKLAEDIERNQSPGAQLEGVSDDEEQAFSAVTREVKEQASTIQHNRRPRPGRQRPIARSSAVNSVTNDLNRVTVSGQKPVEARKDDQDVSSVTTDVEPVVHDTAPTSTKTTEVKVNEVEVPEPVVAKPSTTAESPTTPAPTTTVTSTSETKVKKSTLDPNAPLFHPMGIQYAIPQHLQQPLPQTQPVPYSAPSAVVSVSHPVTFAVQTLPALISAQQAQRFAVTMPYVSHSNQLPHLVPTMMSGPVPGNMHQQMRAGSLPPGLHQQGFQAALNSGANIFLQHPQQPDHGHPIPIFQYAPGLMFAPNQPNAGYYPSPAMLAAPNSINPAGVLPMVNQSASNAQPPPGGHPQGTVDPSLLNSQQLSNAQFQQMTCQPQHLLPQFNAAQAQFVHAQQLNANQHLNQQAMTQSAYQAMAAIASGGAANLSQGH
ncbi:unnamed protein product [Echinostoma caproni]|uniref:LsmAD domain-containing protein n=1 Tax=Echinostoma caproni TaxID=27848 RepID=A0A183AHP9_9TREM|nr:unnamed protein product [Echinostoma caproni]